MEVDIRQVTIDIITLNTIYHTACIISNGIHII